MDEHRDRLWIEAGVVRGRLKSGGFIPLELVLAGFVIARPVPRQVEGTPSLVEISHPLPAAAMNQGLSILMIRREGEETPLAHLPILIGEDLTETLAGEVALLRAELDMVKTILRERLRRGA
ncbi:hypothetical protein [Pontivivens ytuae]|uniref:Uncharacterized protein n=1 Tax=Pontivivens ytuae TaxID=2789856 RepID=A0A7S9LPK9_9RHOB|nr:hypothetical protein [Pontivivens ytuae]QPH52951.1 hypothetical protein I0K15_14195 [Pontivivens ytuae]